jgi:two-component system sensor histidine kinase GlrK
VLTTRRAVSSARELTDIAQRFRDISTIQLGRLTEVWADAQRFKITHGDTAFIGRMEQTLREYDGELRRLDSAALSRRETTLLPPLTSQWNRALALGMSLREHGRDTAIFSQLKESLDSVSAATASLASASQDAMEAELDAVQLADRDAEQVTLGVAGAAVLLSVILTTLIARSILEPLARLTEGTREVSAGRFSHRLTPSGNDELARVAREFNAMTERLDELDRMKREFVSKVSHDLKTPLSSMQETTAVMLDEVPGPLSPKQRQLLLINQESGQRLYAMITKLLDLSRIEAGLDAERQVINVESLIRRSVDHLVEGSSATRVTVEAETGPGLRVLGELDSLTQVFDNLLDNALKFSPFDGKVAVRLATITSRGTIPPERWAAVRRSGIRAPASVLVTVSDEGPGITDDEKERVFDRFYQTAAGRSVRSRGVGLGLAICREIIAVHGGAIWVSDNEPRGSVFHVLLPGVSENGEVSSSPPMAATAVRRRA